MKWYQKHKERLQKEARERYQNLSEEVKDKRRKKARERYQHFIEEKKDKWWKKAPERYQNFIEEAKEKRYYQYYLERQKRLSDYRKKYYLTHKKYLSIVLKILGMNFTLKIQKILTFEFFLGFTLDLFQDCPFPNTYQKYISFKKV